MRKMLLAGRNTIPTQREREQNDGKTCSVISRREMLEVD